jgi:hypothetical protein
VDDGSKTIVARFHDSTLGIIGKKRKASLEILPAGTHIIDQIVITFLYMDKLRKDSQNELVFLPLRECMMSQFGCCSTEQPLP